MSSPVTLGKAVSVTVPQLPYPEKGHDNNGSYVVRRLQGLKVKGTVVPSYPRGLGSRGPLWTAKSSDLQVLHRKQYNICM